MGECVNFILTSIPSSFPIVLKDFHDGSILPEHAIIPTVIPPFPDLVTFMHKLAKAINSVERMCYAPQSFLPKLKMSWLEMVNCKGKGGPGLILWLATEVLLVKLPPIRTEYI
jgi:hypothetical protein